MREIKFRARDKRARKWRVVTSLVWYKPDTGKAGVCGAVIVTDTNHDQFMPIEDIELVEFTGLKDKNGVEIYEGDILGKRPYGYLKADGTKDGRYKGKEWNCFAVKWGEYDASEAGLVSGYEYDTDGKYAGWNIIVGGFDSDLENNEVIGNIYDNPGLLGEES